MAIDLTIGGIQEQIKYAVRDRIQAKLDDLNAALLARTDFAYLVSAPYGEILSSHVGIGMLRGFWTPDNGNGLVRIRVFNVSEEDDRACYISDFLTIGRSVTSGFFNTFYTGVACYLHPSAIVHQDKEQQAEWETIIGDIFLDWLRGVVFNAYDAETLTLGSQEYNSGADYDTVSSSQIVQGKISAYGSGYNESVYGLAIRGIHSCRIGG